MAFASTFRSPFQDMSLLMALNDAGRWRIINNLTLEKTVLYFRDYIYTKGLEEIESESENIMR